MANSETDVLIEDLLNPSSGGDGTLFASSTMRASPAINIQSCPTFFSILTQPNGEVLLHMKQLIIENTTGATLTNQDGIILSTSDYAGFMFQARAIERALLQHSSDTLPSSSSSDTLPSSSENDEFLKPSEKPISYNPRTPAKKTSEKPVSYNPRTLAKKTSKKRVYSKCTK